MEQRTDLSKLLDMMVQPGFSVRQGVICHVNQAARGLLVDPGSEVEPLFATGREEYAAFSEGCLYLQVKLGNGPIGAAVLRMDGGDIFVLDPEPDSRELTALALAAQQLRLPLSSIMYAADQIASLGGQVSEPSGRLQRGLNQLLRIVGNMSDALLYSQVTQMENRNLSAVFDEIFEKARALLKQAGLELQYEGLREDVYTLADTQQLERAVLNILSNAAKFTPAGGRISAALTRRDQTLRLSIADSGPGIREDILGQIFHRYLRQPGIEESRYGLGLGMVLIRTVAANHGGTVLIDQTEGARITMTLSLRQPDSAALRSPVFHVDYAGGRDHALMELSESLPAKLFERN